MGALRRFLVHFSCHFSLLSSESNGFVSGGWNDAWTSSTAAWTWDAPQGQILSKSMGGSARRGALEEGPREGPRRLSCHLYPLLLISCCWYGSDKLRGPAKNELHDDTRPADQPLRRLSHTGRKENLDLTNGSATRHKVGNWKRRRMSRLAEKHNVWGGGGERRMRADYFAVHGPEAVHKANQLNKHRKVGGKCSCDGVYPWSELKAAGH